MRTKPAPQPGVHRSRLQRFTAQPGETSAIGYEVSFSLRKEAGLEIGRLSNILSKASALILAPESLNLKLHFVRKPLSHTLPASLP